MSNILGLANPLTDITPTTTLGNLVDIYIGVLALAVFGVAVGKLGILGVTEQLVRRQHALIDRLLNRPPNSPPPELLGFAFFLLLVLPVLVCAASVVFGGVVAAAETFAYNAWAPVDKQGIQASGDGDGGNADGSGYWSFNQGFLYIISNVLGYGTPLTNVTPTNWIAQAIAPVKSFAEDYFSALHSALRARILILVWQCSALFVTGCTPIHSHSA